MLARKAALALAAALVAALGWFALQGSEAPDGPLLSGASAVTDATDVGETDLPELGVDEARVAAGVANETEATEASAAPP